MKLNVKQVDDDRWAWWLSDDEGCPVARGFEDTETLAHAALRQAASLQWPRGDED